MRFSKLFFFFFLLLLLLFAELDNNNNNITVWIKTAYDKGILSWNDFSILLTSRKQPPFPLLQVCSHLILTQIIIKWNSFLPLIKSVRYIFLCKTNNIIPDNLNDHIRFFTSILKLDRNSLE